MELFETDKNSSAKEFLNYAGAYVMDKKNYAISTTVRMDVQKIATSHLGLKDIFQLRDRFEGQAYLDNLLLKVSAISVVERASGQSFLDWDKIMDDRNCDFMQITLNDTVYRVIPFFFGSLPFVNIDVQEPLIFVAVRVDFKHGIICGSLEEYSTANTSIFISKTGGTKNNFKKFIGFRQLKELYWPTDL